MSGERDLFQELVKDLNNLIADNQKGALALQAAKSEYITRLEKQLELQVEINQKQSQVNNAVIITLREQIGLLSKELRTHGVDPERILRKLMPDDSKREEVSTPVEDSIQKRDSPSHRGGILDDSVPTKPRSGKSNGRSG